MLIDARRPINDGTFDEPILWKRSALIFGSSQPAVVTVLHTRSITSSRTYKKPEPFGACSHLCGLAEYMSQPMSRMFNGIIPGTCAPSTADRIPFDRANADNSLAGSTVPVAVEMWLKNITRVRGVIASLNRFSTSAGLFTGLGSETIFTP